MRSPIARVVPLILLLASACGGDAAGPDDGPPPAPGSASIGPQGGALTASLGGGASVTLTVPAGALAGTVAFTLTPGTPTGAERARFTIEPDDAALRAPVTLELTLPGGATPAASDAFALLAPDAVPLPTERDAGRRVLRTRLDRLVLGGTQPPAVDFARGRMPPGGLPSARAAAGSAAVVVLPADLASRLDVARDAIALIGTAPTLLRQLAAADRAELAMLAAFQLASPQSDAATRQVAIDWGNELCQEFNDVVLAFRTIPGETIAAFKASAAPMIEWGTRFAAFGDAFEPGAPPAAACASGPPDVAAALAQQGARLLDFLDAELARIDATTRVGATELVARAKDGIEIATWFAGAGLDEVRNAAFATVGRNVARVREPAYELCRAEGDWSQYRQLFGFLLTIESIPGISTAELGADIHYCGTPLRLRVENADAVAIAEPVFGGGNSPGLQRDTLTQPVPVSARRVLLPSTVRAVRCPVNGAFANEQLVITAGSAEIARLSPSNGTYPVPLLSRTIAELRSAAGAPAEGSATVVLAVRRTGTGCPVQDQLFDYPPSRDLARVTLTLQPPLAVTTTSLPEGVVGRPYVATLQAVGGVGQRNWTVTGGALPPGIALATSGALSGTPTAAGAFAFDARVTAEDDAAERRLTLRVVPPLAATAPAGAGTVGQPLSLAIQATGGTGTYAFAVTQGGLPAGLSLNAATGVVSGTPATAGTTTFAVTVTSGTQTVTVTITITVTNTPPPPTDPWTGRWAGTITNQRFIPARVSDYEWQLQFDAILFEADGTVRYLSFPGTDFACRIRPANNDRNSTAFTGDCGRPGVNFFNVRGTRSATRIDAIGDDPTTTFADDFTIALQRRP